jgi:hypothetical protein
MFLQLYENCQEVHKVNPLRRAELTLQKRRQSGVQSGISEKKRGRKTQCPKKKNSLVPEDLLAEAQATIRKTPRKKKLSRALSLSLSLFSFSYAFTKNVWKESMDLRK